MRPNLNHWKMIIPVSWMARYLDVGPMIHPPVRPCQEAYCNDLWQADRLGRDNCGCSAPQHHRSWRLHCLTSWQDKKQSSLVTCILKASRPKAPGLLQYCHHWASVLEHMRLWGAFQTQFYKFLSTPANELPLTSCFLQNPRQGSPFWPLFLH